MKHIFKKLHIGSNHEPNRSNETALPASPSSASCAFDHRRASSLHSPASPSSSPSPAPAAAAAAAGIHDDGGDGAGLSAVNTAAAAARPDYFSSEEEFQMQLALAISASSSNSDLRDEREKDQIRAATLLSLDPIRVSSPRDHGGVSGAAEALSRQYWVRILPNFRFCLSCGRELY